MALGGLSGTKYLLVIPILFFVLSGVLETDSSPHHMGYNIDPDYPYLFNSLNLLSLQSPKHTDHPGTTLQEFGAAVIYCKWWLQSLAGTSHPIDEAVLAEPESYLHAINVALNLLICGLVFVCAFNIYRYSGLFWPALLFEAAIWLFSLVPIAQSRISPEPLLIASACAFFLPFLPLLFGHGGSDDGSRPSTAFTSGALFAFGMVTKVTFFPFGIYCFLLKGARQKLRFWTAAGCGVIVLTAPILSQLQRVALWLWGLVTHQGAYGAGNAGLPPLLQYEGGLRLLYNVEPFLFVVLLYFAGVLLWLHFASTMSHGLGKVKTTSRFILLTCAAIVLQVAVTAMHAASQYILPVLLIPAFVGAMLSARFLRASERRKSAVIMAIGGTAILLLGMIRTAAAVDNWVASMREYRQEIRRIAMAGPRNCMRIGFYRSSLPSFALAFGNEWSGLVHGSMLNVLYPDTLAYNLFLDKFLTYEGAEVRASEIQDRLEAGACMLVQGNPEYGAPEKLAQKVNLVPLFTGEHESLYQLTSKGLAFLVSNLALPADAIVVEAEDFSAGGVVVDTVGYGAGIGVITSAKFPTFAEYHFPVKQPGRYAIWVRYATLAPRPMSIIVNGVVVTRNAFSEPTGGWNPQDQRWAKLGNFEARAENMLRIEGDGPFPHIDKLAFIRDKGVKPNGGAGK